MEVGESKTTLGTLQVGSVEDSGGYFGWRDCFLLTLKDQMYSLRLESVRKNQMLTFKNYEDYTR